MFEYELKKSLVSDADFIWELISHSDRLQEIIPGLSRVAILSGNQKGMTRRLYHKNGRSWEERCVDWQEKRCLSMHINTSDHPLPAAQLRSIFAMERHGKNITVTLRCEYTPHHWPLGLLMSHYRIKPVLRIYMQQMMENINHCARGYRQRAHNSVRSILEKKKKGLLSISPDTQLSEACTLLTKHKVGCALVLDGGPAAVMGIISERDIVHHLSQSGPAALNDRVADCMTKEVIVCHPDDHLADIMGCMNHHRVRHLPVVDDGTLLGIVSIGDTVQARIRGLEGETEIMRQYIEGRKWREMALQIGRGAAIERLGKT